MIRKVDCKDENYQGLTRALALGAVNGPYTEYLEGGEKAVAIGEIAAEILSSEWLAELIRKEREDAWEVGAYDYASMLGLDYSDRMENPYSNGSNET